VTDREKLQRTIQQLEATGEELQSANEELETTNEELQSTNEELETTNEELQSTNEELETTNEELQSLNEELENMNEELEQRTQELNLLNQRYGETLRSMPWPVVLVDRQETIQLWNSAAQQLFGVGATSVVGVDLDHLPIEGNVRKALVRRCRTVMEKTRPSVLRLENVRINHDVGDFEVHFTPVPGRNKNEVEGVLIMFGPVQARRTPAVPPTATVAKPAARRTERPAGNSGRRSGNSGNGNAGRGPRAN
jgi:two-component system CheB/CheR fusion protein